MKRESIRAAACCLALFIIAAAPPWPHCSVSTESCTSAIPKT